MKEVKIVFENSQEIKINKLIAGFIIFLFYFFLSVLSQNIIYSQTNGQQDFRKDLIKNIEWRYIGPDRGGRSCTVSGVKDNPYLYYAGYTGGGVWKTTDAGMTWQNISDGYFGGSIGVVAVSESNSSIIYVGEGEKTIRGNVSSGEGVWKSIDAGKTWEHIGLDNSMQISRIRIHPKNPDIVYVAVLGNLWKSSNERGVYKTTDGGNNWERILFSNKDAGAVDLILDPTNPEIIYASTYNVRRNGYRLDSGGPGSHLWKSRDGGNTWDTLTTNPGMPKGILGNIGVTVSPLNPNRIWAVIEAVNGGLYRSDDAGKTWELTSNKVEVYQKAYYYCRLYADPINPDKVYVLNTPLLVSEDGGKSFREIKGTHVDHHDIWIDPNNPKRMIDANDGGVQISFNGGESWSSRYNQGTAQIYRITTDNSFPYRIYGAQQDHGTIRILHTASGYKNKDLVRPWEESAGGESGYLAPHPNNPDIVFGGTYKGYMLRYDHKTKQTRSTNVWPLNPVGSGVEVMKYRFNWNYPIFFSPHNPNKLYTASNYLHVSYNEGQSWEVISPDLTRGIPETMNSSGGPIADDNTGVEFYATIITATESKLEEGVIWTGSDDGLIHVTMDGGRNWKNVTPPESICPKLNMINDIVVSPFKKGGAYVAGTEYKFGNSTPYLYKTDNYGKTWQLITNGIPIYEFTRTVEADPIREGLLYTGTEKGLFISFDDGNNWEPFQNNLPIVPVRDLEIKNNNLIAATHGRGIWIIDDLTLLQQTTENILAKPSHLFQPNDIYRSQKCKINFFLNSFDTSSVVKLAIKDKSEKVITTFSNKSDSGLTCTKFSEGYNSVEWDTRYPGFVEIPDMVFYSAPNKGPLAIPGKYLVTLTVDDSSESQSFNIIHDPTLNNTKEDYQKQFDYLINVRDWVSKAHITILHIRELKQELNSLQLITELKDEKDVLTIIEKLYSVLDEIENNLNQNKSRGGRDPLKYGIKLNNQMAFLLHDQQRGDFPPTDQAVEVFEMLASKINDQQVKLKSIVDNRLPLLNDHLSEINIEQISVEKILLNK